MNNAINNSIRIEEEKIQKWDEMRKK